MILRYCSTEIKYPRQLFIASMLYVMIILICYHISLELAITVNCYRAMKNLILPQKEVNIFISYLNCLAIKKLNITLMKNLKKHMANNLNYHQLHRDCCAPTVPF